MPMPNAQFGNAQFPNNQGLIKLNLLFNNSLIQLVSVSGAFQN